MKTQTPNGKNKVPAPREICGAKTRNGHPCRNHPVREKRRCRMHGGTSTGPRTVEGRTRIARAHLKHGQRRRAILAEQKRHNAEGKRIQAELDTLEQAAITAGWLTRDWRKQF